VIVTVTPTIRDGQVVRWYGSEEAAQYGDEMLSVSRNGVRVHAYLDDVPDDVLTQARDAHRVLAAGGDVGHLATHRKERYGDLEPIGAVAG